MTGQGYVIVAYVIGGGLLWGYAFMLWAREYRASKSHRNHGGRS